jgi:phosphopantothenoylcysteine synthetase/decarboxylase
LVIVFPATPQVIEAVAAGLERDVASEPHEPPAQLAMGMALQVLRAVAVRTANEREWMHQESAAIEELAGRLLDELPDGGAGLRTALDAYLAGAGEERCLDAAVDNYQRASEVLSCATELVYLAGSAQQRAAVHRLFEQRLAHENAITGGYKAVGRSE